MKRKASPDRIEIVNRLAQQKQTNQSGIIKKYAFAFKLKAVAQAEAQRKRSLIVNPDVHIQVVKCFELRI